MTAEQIATIDFMMRPNPYPDLKIGDEVVLCAELGGLRGRIRWSDGSDRSWAVTVPYGGDGALVYVHKADVRPLSAPSEPVQDQPRVWAIQTIPEDVNVVTDYLARRWNRETYGRYAWVLTPMGFRATEIEMVSRYAPLTEVVSTDG